MVTSLHQLQVRNNFNGYLNNAVLLTDINNALSTGAYPEKLSYKLHLRKGLSLKGLKLKKESDAAFMDAEALLGASGLDQEKIDKVKEIIRDVFKKSLV